jgi:hypothetical protein
MRIFNLCGGTSSVVSNAHQQKNKSVVITATTPEQAHLFRMMEIHGRCQEIEHRMIDAQIRIAATQKSKVSD